jgi:hypothetical protein
VVATGAGISTGVLCPAGRRRRDRQLAQLKQLGELKAQGVITEEEFAAQKAEILGG